MKSLYAAVITYCFFFASGSYATNVVLPQPDIFGPWHTADLNKPTECRLVSSYDACPDLVFSTNEAFDPLKWKQATDRRRSRMLFRFSKDYKLIGMNRSKVHLLLGSPELVTKNATPDRETPDQEWYGIDFECDLTGQFMELAYKKDKVVAFRAVTSNCMKVLTQKRKIE